MYVKIAAKALTSLSKTTVTPWNARTAARRHSVVIAGKCFRPRENPPKSAAATVKLAAAVNKVL